MDFSAPFGGVVPGAQGAVLAVLMRTEAPLTGRRVHSIVSDAYSLWTVQQVLRELALLGLTEVQQIGRAGVHRVNDDHVAVGALRVILNPLGLLTDVVRESVGDRVSSVVVFGSVARGEAGPASDVDLAVIAPEHWNGRVELETAVRTRLGNACDVLHLVETDLDRPGGHRDPVFREIFRDGIALVGALPETQRGVMA